MEPSNLSRSDCNSSLNDLNESNSSILGINQSVQFDDLTGHEEEDNEFDLEEYILNYNIQELDDKLRENDFFGSDERCCYHHHVTHKCNPCHIKKIDKVLGMCKKHFRCYVLKKQTDERLRIKAEAENAKREQIQGCKEYKDGKDLSKNIDFEKLLKESVIEDEKSEEEELEPIKDIDYEKGNIYFKKAEDTLEEYEDDDELEIVEWEGESKIKIDPEMDDERTIMEKEELIRKEKELKSLNQSISIGLMKEVYFNLIGYACLKSGNKKALKLPKVLREDQATKKLFPIACKDLARDLKIDLACMPSYASMMLQHSFLAAKVLYLD